MARMQRWIAITENLSSTTKFVAQTNGTGFTLTTVSVGDLPTVTVAKGGTGLTSGTSGGVPYFDSTSTMASSALLTQYGLLIGGGAGAAPTALAAMTNGQIVIGSTGVSPVVAALTGTADQVVVTNGAGTITLSTPQSINTTSSPTFVTVTGSTSLESARLSTTAANGQKGSVKTATTLLSAFTGATMTATNLIPAGSVVLGVTIRVTTAITSGDGATDMTIGDGTDADRWGTGIAFALDTTTTGTAFTITSVPIYAAATSVVFTANGGTFNAGAVRVTVHYVDFTAATS